ncbi:hypothetical protein [Thalassobius sp. Cn5-15]|jgi:hypothetical protein|uniref:hypothetical protein n=1 Tax=Thalassobius sp. Cn5-15 TaxID=2917763 RepID=UPI001EF386F4|nr:hypothetical protein [Thalassobius sp. Cn5-15]MCG7493225.1 hypothetical protein [Thalassobius sp. Cn5-15]
MSDAFNEFDNRLRRIDEKNARLKENGFVTTVNRDGLIVVRPQRKRSVLPWRGLLFLLLGFIGFKTLLLAGIGFATYQERVDDLYAGGVVERAGAFLMQPDPISESLALKVRPYLR